MRAGNFRIALGCISVCLGAMAFADESSITDKAPVADAVLDEVRGGFEMPTSLHASMILDRSAYLNGELVVHRSVSIPDIGNMTTEQAAALAQTAGTLVIQNGPNNAFDVGDLGPASTVIQNTLNDQHLVTLTTLSVEVNSLAAYREMNFQDGLRDTLTISGVR